MPSAGGPLPSAVNVEEFTLNAEVVRVHQEAGAQWRALDQTLAAARASGDADRMLAAVRSGLDLLEKIGPENSPMQCEASLRMEEAQCLFNTKHFDEADKILTKVVADLKGAPRLDDVLLANAREFHGFVLLELGRCDAAFAIFSDLLKWIDTGVSRAMPMVAVAAKNMRRTTQTGLGMAQQARGIVETDRALISAGLDNLIEALTQHIENNDVYSVKQTLAATLQCFVALDDAKQAIETCEKYVSWCRRNGDEEAAKEGELRLGSLKEKYGNR